jgi:hypothetical protein
MKKVNLALSAKHILGAWAESSGGSKKRHRYGNPSLRKKGVQNYLQNPHQAYPKNRTKS